MLTCKITLPDSPHPTIVIKNPGFRALYLAGWKEFHRTLTRMPMHHTAVT